MSRHRSTKAERLSPVLVRLIEAAEHSGKDAEGNDISGAAKALREFGKLALWAVPVHGVFVANNDDVSVAIERAANNYLGLEEPCRDLGAALEAVKEFAQREPIESAHNHVRSVAEEAYFYAGLAFGVTLGEYGVGSR